MKFDLVSDLHTDIWHRVHPDYRTYGSPRWDPGAPLLVVAGDTANDPKTVIDRLEDAAAAYDHVAFTDGNHEHYGTHPVDETRRRFRAYADDRKKVTFLDGPDAVLDLMGVRFAGVNGWYSLDANNGLTPDEHYSVWHNQIADSQIITFERHMSEAAPSLVIQRARNDAERLARAVEDAQNDAGIQAVVLVTHTVPHPDGTVPVGHVHAPENGSFENSFMSKVRQADRSRKIRIWCFGHTHYPHDFQAHGVRFVANPCGYPGERALGSYRPLTLSAN